LNIVDAFRYGILGIYDVSVILGFSLVCALFTILSTWSLILLQRGTGLRT
jgi:ABC-2 type transport system permease protein